MPSDEGYRCLSCGRVYPVVDGITSFVPEDGETEGFESHLFQALEHAEEHHFWFIARREIILDTLRRYVPDVAGGSMLEIGCGNGNILRFLQERTDLQMTGGDLFIEGLRFCRERVDMPLYQIDATRLPFRERFDVIGMFDVLEHIEDDDRVLTECRKALKDGGRLLLTVPVCPSLWGPFDEYSHHQRRYVRGELRRKLEAAGFTVERAPHFMFFLFPLAYASRLLKRMLGRSKSADPTEVPYDLRTFPVVNGVFLWLLRLEKLLMRYVDLPFGTSLLVVACKS